MPLKKFLDVFKSDKTQYVFSKYFYNAMQFLSIFILAKNVEAIQFAIYASIKLTLQYLSYSNLGVNYSFININSLQPKIKHTFILNFLRQSIKLNFSTGVFVCFPLTILLASNLANIYDLQKPSWMFLMLTLWLLALTKQLNLLFQGYFRLTNRLTFLNLYFIGIGITELTVIILRKNKSTLIFEIFEYLVIANIVFLVYATIKSKVFKFKDLVIEQKKLLIKGVSLLAYNFSFYSITLFMKTSVEKTKNAIEFANFSFITMFNEGVMLLVNGALFLIMPKALNIIGNCSDQKLNELIKKKQSILRVLTLILIPISSIGYTILVSLLPDYLSTVKAATVLIVSNIFILQTFIPTLYLQKKNLEIFSIIIGLIIGLAWIFLTRLQFYENLTLITISTICTVFFVLYYLIHQLVLKYVFNKTHLNTDWLTLAALSAYIILVYSSKNVVLINILILIFGVIKYRKLISTKGKEIVQIVMFKSDMN